MAFIDYIDFPNHPAVAEDTVLGQMAREAARLINDVNDNFPDWARPVPRIIEPWGDAVRTIANRPGPPPIPALPFTGGQCCSTTYEIVYQYVTPGGTSTVNAAFTGKLGSPQVVSQPDGLLGANIPYTRCDGVTQYLAAWANVAPESYQDGLYGPITIAAVIPLYGGANNCGDPLPVFPPAIPRPDDLRRTGDIVIAPGLTIPVNFVYIRPDIDVDVNVDAKFNIPVTINLPDFNIDFNFDVGGININIGTGGGGTTIPTKPDVRDPKPQPSFKETNYDAEFRFINSQLRRLKEEIDDIKDCACETPTNVQTISYPAAESRTIALPAKTFLVRLTMTQVPTNARKQFGGDAPDVLYAGWAAFGYAGGGWAERMPIDYAEKSFIPPEEAQGFSYTCYTLYKASLVVYYEVEST